MKARIELARIAAAIELLKRVNPERRLARLRKLILNNGGRWDLPSEARGRDGAPIYNPLLISVELFGVYAMADDVDELAKNWMRCARNILDAAGDDRAEVA
ncbi:hypothetical protein [Pukyongiella litopenaei]|uniref:Uncharacterized protein n=1 Tax=Pukyongiella litopenaei TaxID=2605946 RepID=A0A2S0MNB2_9RHOB|nr:hypothetical protein [Pukyongiella litopenaei]AVO37364.1 hypothetical protein C6Y53_06335 [Pukyongiella litopenaei]